MNKKYAVIGTGGREHAIAWKLAQSLGWDAVFTLSGNAGIPNSHVVDTNDFDAVANFCQAHGIQTIFVGNEAPLTLGIVDYFKTHFPNIRVFGANKTAAQLEGSKIFAKQFMERYHAKTSPFANCQQRLDAQLFIQERAGNLVIKYDGLAAGKGVYVCSSIAECEAALDELEAQYGDTFPFLVEEKLIGDEISIIGFADGNTIKLLLPAQDHKQLLDDDEGANTGGMGVYCPVHWCDDALMAQIWRDAIQPTINGLIAENFDYKGIIYFGLMITTQGAYLLEYNARLGDPEAEVLMPALRSDLPTIVEACLDGRLHEIEFEFNDGFFVDVVQVAGGYPKQYAKGHTIHGLENVDEHTLVFMAGVAKNANNQLVTNGGRVLNVVANAPTLAEAIERAYQNCERISFQDNFYRKDIAQRQRKIQLIQS